MFGPVLSKDKKTRSENESKTRPKPNGVHYKGEDSISAEIHRYDTKGTDR